MIIKQKIHNEENGILIFKIMKQVTFIKINNGIKCNMCNPYFCGSCNFQEIEVDLGFVYLLNTLQFDATFVELIPRMKVSTGIFLVQRKHGIFTYYGEIMG